MSQKIEKSQKARMFSIVDKIEEARENNNFCWMDLLRLAIQHAPRDAARIMARVYEQDSTITKLSKELIDIGLQEEKENEA